jgi:hypothetical protein
VQIGNSMLNTAKSRHLLAAAVGSIFALVCAPTTAPAQQKAPRSNEASCRQAANGLVSLLDAKQDDTALYRDTYAVVVNTCGPAGTAPRSGTPPSLPVRAQCRDLAAAMVDLIEDDAMESAKFSATRDAFAAACAPK